MQNQQVKISAEKQAEIMEIYEDLEPTSLALVLLDLMRMQRIFLQSMEGSGMNHERKNEFENHMFTIEQLLELAIR
ncbi:MAG: hypothetical protein EBR82_17440 [Caulobacteraceae bacterium]|nr:hypothetical protein [Caulobacteraceae bacterium]